MGLVYLPFVIYHKNLPDVQVKNTIPMDPMGLVEWTKIVNYIDAKKMKHLKTLKYISTKQD